jgi:hypothetical protein
VGVLCARGVARRRRPRRRATPTLPRLSPPRRAGGATTAAAGAPPRLLRLLLLLTCLTARSAAQLAWANGEATSTDTAPYDYNATVTHLGAVPDARCCAWSRWCPGGALRFRCTPAVLAACGAGGTGPRCDACAVCAAAAATPAALALRATAPLSDASQARAWRGTHARITARTQRNTCLPAFARMRKRTRLCF